MVNHSGSPTPQNLQKHSFFTSIAGRNSRVEPLLRHLRPTSEERLVAQRPAAQTYRRCPEGPTGPEDSEPFSRPPYEEGGPIQMEEVTHQEST